MSSLWHSAQRKDLCQRQQRISPSSPQVFPVCRSLYPCPERCHRRSRQGSLPKETCLLRARMRFHHQQTRKRRRKPSYFARTFANSPNSPGESSRARLLTNGTSRASFSASFFPTLNLLLMNGASELLSFLLRCVNSHRTKRLKNSSSLTSKGAAFQGVKRTITESTGG